MLSELQVLGDLFLQIKDCGGRFRVRRGEVGTDPGLTPAAFFVCLGQQLRVNLL